MTRQLLTIRETKSLLGEFRLRDALFLRDLNVEFQGLQGTEGTIERIDDLQLWLVPVHGDNTQPDVIQEVVDGV